MPPAIAPKHLTHAARRTAAWLGLALCLSAAPLAAQAAVITFDDLACGTAGLTIPSPYAGLNWDNFGCINGALFEGGNSGYNAGRKSGDNVAANLDGAPAKFDITAPAGAKFNFNSVYLTGAWNDDLVVTIKAYRDGTLISTTTRTLSATTPALVALNLTNIDRVLMSSAGGTHHAGYPGGGTQFAMDNLDIDIAAAPPQAVTPVPTLSQWSLLLLAGALGAAALRQRRRG